MLNTLLREIREGSISIRPTRRSISALIEEYSSNPTLFWHQFGRSIDDREQVCADAERAAASGLCAYFDVDLLEGKTMTTFAHLRVDFGLDDGMIALHGGSPYRIKEQSKARLDGWRLMISAAFSDPGITRIASATAKGNRPAQIFLANSGFRRIRLIKNFAGQETIRYILARRWFTGLSRSISCGNIRLSDFRSNVTAPINAVHSMHWPTPDFWHRITGANEQEWIDALRHVPLHAARLAGATEFQTFDLDQAIASMRFNARHGTTYFGWVQNGRPVAVVAAQSYPQRPKLMGLRGGPWFAESAAPSLMPWLTKLAHCGKLDHAEVSVPADDAIQMHWWQAAGMLADGYADITPNGEPAEIAMVWHRRCANS